MTARTQPLLHYLRHLTARSRNDASDAVLLERFVSRRDETAFTALLARHGPMVLGVCRRILGDDHDAEDAFQAAFLLLARKASSLRHPETLAAWLYGVARRLALTVQRSNNRRRQRERESVSAALVSAAASPLDELSARELLMVLDAEMARLPERYRLPLILCGLEGRSHEEAARILGWTLGSLKGRLERGRKKLHTRLTRRGLAFSGTLLTLGVLPGGTASAAGRLSFTTLQAALTFARGERGGIAATVLALAETGVTSMTMTKAKVGLILLLALGLVGGTGVLAYPLRSEKQAEDKQTTATITPERKTETPKSARDKAAPTDLYGDPLPSGAIARLGTVRFRHGGWLRDVLISPDGRTLISSGAGSIELWDAASGRRQRRISVSTPFSVNYMDLSPDGKLLAVADLSSELRFWNLASGAEVYPFGDAAPLASQAAFSPNGKLLATAGAKANRATVRIWDIRERKKICTMEAGGVWNFRSLAFSPNSKMLAFPDDSGVRVWDVAADKELYRLDLDPKTPIGCVAFSSDGKLLAAAGDPYKHGPDHAIHLWDAVTGKKVGVLKGHEDNIAALSMSPKSNLLASASRDGTIRFWDLESREELGKCSGPRREYLVALAFSADGRVLASGENNGAIRLWDARTRQEIATPAAGANCVQWAAFAPDGQTLITTEKEELGLWEPLTGRPRQIFNNKFLGFFHPALSPDGKSLVTVDGTEGQIILWDVATGKLVRRFGEGGQRGRISSCMFSANGRLLAGGSYQEDIIRVWDVASGKEVQQLKGQHMSRPLAFAPDGATLASASAEANGDYTVRLWKLATGEEIWRKTTDPWTAFDLTFSPDGRTLVLVGGMPGRQNTTGEVRLWDAATGKELRCCEGHRERVACVAFSRDGRMLATGSLDNTVRLWEVATGRERQCFRGHQSMISAVSFSPEGRLLVSASGDTTALVWDLTGRFRDGRFQPRHLSAEELNRCWNDLADADAARAYRSVCALQGSPGEAVPFLKDHLLPVTVADPKRVAALLAALDSDQFAERDKAMTELEKLGLGVEPALRKALNAKPSLETRRRIEAILEKLAGGPRLRVLRALEVLENIATPEAWQVLEAISEGPAEMWPTQEAKASLVRLTAHPLARP